jgi:hypothetical protein
MRHRDLRLYRAIITVREPRSIAQRRAGALRLSFETPVFTLFRDIFRSVRDSSSRQRTR